MAPVDRLYTTSYQSAIVNIAQSCTTSEILDIEEYGDLVIYTLRVMICTSTDPGCLFALTGLLNQPQHSYIDQGDAH